MCAESLHHCPGIMLVVAEGFEREVLPAGCGFFGALQCWPRDNAFFGSARAWRAQEVGAACIRFYSA